MSDNYVFFDDLRAHAPLPEDGILSRTLHGDERAKVIQFCFAKGQELSAHTAPYPATLAVSQEGRLIETGRRGTGGGRRGLRVHVAVSGARDQGTQ